MSNTHTLSLTFGSRALVTRPRHLMGIPLLSKNNQLSHKSNLIFGLKLSSADNKGKMGEEGFQRGTQASLRVPAQRDILSNDRHSRWQETGQTRVCVHPLGFRMNLQDLQTRRRPTAASYCPATFASSPQITSILFKVNIWSVLSSGPRLNTA